MTRIGFTAIGFVLLALVLASASGARPFFGEPPPGPPHDGFVGYHADRLGLDEETRATIDEIVAKSRAAAEELHEEIRKARERLHELLTEETPDEDAVLGQAEVIGGLETELHKHRLRSLLEIGSHLTSEQRAELKRIREEGPFRRFWNMRDACADDVETLCGGAGPGPRAFFCLRDHADDLSEACAEALDAMPLPPGGHHRGRHGHFPHGF